MSNKRNELKNASCFDDSPILYESDILHSVRISNMLGLCNNVTIIYYVTIAM